MIKTIPIKDSEEVMAELGTQGLFFRTKRENVRITGISNNTNIPLEVRTALVDLVIPTIFTREALERRGIKFDECPPGSRFAYCLDVIEVLKSDKKYQEARQLQDAITHRLKLYAIEPQSYELM